jgi:cytidine deaminase
MRLPSLPERSPGEDGELLRIAGELLARIYVPGRHEVAAALRTRDGSVHTGVHLEGSARRSSICAEGVALGTALVAGPLEVDTILAVHFKPPGVIRVIAPCGVCRELLCDLCPDAYVYAYRPAPDERPDGTTPESPSPADPPGTIERLTATELLPLKPRRRW